MRLVAPVRFGDGEFDEEEREKRKDRRLHDAYEELEAHERHREHRRNEERGDGKQDFARENVAEETERERNEARQFAHEFDDADDEIQRRREIEELPRVAEEPDGDDACDLDSKNGDDSECERDVEVSVDAPKEREKFIPVENADRADARRELEQVRDRDEEEDGHEEREHAPRPCPAFQGFRDVIVYE